MDKMWLVLLVFETMAYAWGESLSLVHTFTDPVTSASSHFNHLTVDKNTGIVYVGAVNRIYQLSPDLDVNNFRVTSPNSINTTDNVNKALLIDYVHNQLITCGSALEGVCSVQDLHNITKEFYEVSEPVVANSAIGSTVAFIAPGPPNPPLTQVMYVGATFTTSSPNRLIPAVSSRSLEDDRLFKVAINGEQIGTKMFVSTLWREQYLIDYVYGFSSGGFSYFLTNQLRVGSNAYYSKLVRVCHDDFLYYSYIEIPMSCSSDNAPDYTYNLLEAAFIGKPSFVLAGQLGISMQDDVLYAAFSKSETVDSKIPSQSSALCVFSLKSIQKKFFENIISCFNGSVSRGLDFITPSTPCIQTKLTSLTENYCGLDVNTPLGGEDPVIAIPVAKYAERLTAVAAHSTGENTVIFAGTTDGKLKRIVISSTSTYKYDDIILDGKSTVNKDLLFDAQLSHLYAMTERKVYKVKIHDCSIYESCITCRGVKDPYCCWCSLENNCSLKSDCLYTAEDIERWMSYTSNHCSIIKTT